MMVSTDPAPPHDLQLVIDFVNTRGLEDDTEALADPAALGVWLRERGLLTGPDEAVVGDAERADALALREALRAVMLGHNGAAFDGAAGAELERAAAHGRLAVRFGADGTVRFEPRAGGIAGALARVLTPVSVAAASNDGTWERVKACRADDCQWAFYDRSRNRAGRWCDMALCGNRTKVRTYRTKSDTSKPLYL